MSLAELIRNGLKVLYVTESVLEWEPTLARQNTSAE